MSIRFFLLGLLLVAGRIAKCDGDLDDWSNEDRLINYLMGAGSDDRTSYIRSINPAERKALIRYVRENRSGRWKEPDGVALHILLLLGDAEEQRKAVEEFYVARSGVPGLYELGEPWAIEAVAAELFREEKFTTGGSDLVRVPISFATADLIVRNLQNSDIYSDKVLAWSKRLNPDDWIGPLPIIRDWWRENERFFKEKNYKAVQPGRDPKPATDMGSTEPPPGASANTTEPVRPTPMAQTLSSQERLVESSGPSSALLLTGAGVTIVLLMGLVVFWKRRV